MILFLLDKREKNYPQNTNSRREYLTKKFKEDEQKKYN